MAFTLLWNSATMPDGCALFEERVPSANRVRAFAGRIGGALASDGGFTQRRITVELQMSGVNPTDYRHLVDGWQRSVGYDFGWLRQLTATMDRRIWCKPDDFDVAYPETIFDYGTLQQGFIAPDPRWESLTTSTQTVLPRSQYLHGSNNLSVTGSAEAKTMMYYWPVYGATELLASVEVTNRFGNLLYNADFAIKVSTTQQGLADPWLSDGWGKPAYDPFLLPEKSRQWLDINANAATHPWVTYAEIPYAPVRNQFAPTTDTVVWSSWVDLQQLTGDWRFYLRLHALMGTFWGGGTANTVTGPVYGTTGAAVTVAGTNWSGRMTVTLTATGGLSPLVRKLRPEFVFVGATGAGTAGGGRISLFEPYVRTDGKGYDYTPHRTVTFEGLAAAGRWAIESDFTERQANLFAEHKASTGAVGYLTDDAEFFELAPESNELHTRVSLSNTSAATGAVTAYPCSTENLVFFEWRDRWWS